ncbi:rubrerythrin-like domain-containing protein [Haloprofundus marisrubri]|nr:rubrerythrin-like domain-containing protein [Haloprofundus marisrubri]
MRDVKPQSDGERSYECFECGTIVVSETNPVTCSRCEGSMRNRGMPIE